MPPSAPPAFPTLRQLYVWSYAQPEDRRSGATPCDCPLALYFRDQHCDIAVEGGVVLTPDYIHSWPMPDELQRFVAEHDAVFWRIDDPTLRPHQVRRVIETLEREAMLTALEERYGD